MTEVQNHGFIFEDWVKEIFFGIPRNRDGSKWDVDILNQYYKPAVNVPIRYQDINISVKTIQSSQSVNLGDIIRQRSINEPFGLVCGFWKQLNKNEKIIIDILCFRFEPAQWQNLWGDLSLQNLLLLDAIVKDKSVNYQQARINAQDWKIQNPQKDQFFTVNPKIDSKKQRRVQVSVNYSKLVNYEDKVHKSRSQTALWDLQFPNPIYSAPRKFKVKKKD